MKYLGKVKLFGYKNHINLLEENDIIKSGDYYINTSELLGHIESTSLFDTFKTFRPIQTKCQGDLISQHPHRSYLKITPI